MWREIDFDAKLWTLPTARAKNATEYQIPLSDSAVEILRALPHIAGADLCFTLSGRVPLIQAGDLEHAVRAAYEDARNSTAPDPVVLLSPACASFDQFRDFEHRGDVFRELVRQLNGAQQKATSMERI